MRALLRAPRHALAGRTLAARGHARRWAAGLQPSVQEVLEAAKQEEQEVPDEPKVERSAVATARGVLWVANVYPTKAFRLDFRQALTHHNHETLIPQLLPDGVEVTKMVPREREGGAFVYFRAPPAFVLQVLRNLSDKDTRFMPKGTDDILLKVTEGICQFLKTHNVRAFLCPHPVRAHRVRGTPYLEDMTSRYPSSQIHVKLEPTPDKKPTEEQVYEVLRRYGQLDELTSTEEGFSARFSYTSGAVAARNCLHRAPLQLEGQEGPMPRFCIEYKQFMQKWLWETISANWRFVFPLFVVCMFGTTYFIWDPMRTAFVHLRLASIFSAPPPPASRDSESMEGDSPYAGLGGLGLRVLHTTAQGLREARASTKLSHEGLFDDFWAERKKEIADLQDWLGQPPERVMLLTGHRGNGLNEMARKLAGHRVLEINVRDMLEVGGVADDHLFLRSFSRAVGYWPAQGMDRQLSAILDLMLPGSGKQLSRENEIMVAVHRVLFAMTQALHDWRFRSSGALNFDATPLILITGFTSQNKDRRPGFFDGTVSWAAYVSEAKLARVVFVADSSFGEPSILSHLKDRPERLSVFQLQDVSEESVRRILERRLTPDKLDLSDAHLKAIGGRYMDIAALLGHMRHGVAADEAVRWLLETAEVTVRRLLLTGQPEAKWTRPQLWRAVRHLTEGTGLAVPYDVILWNVFRGDEGALRSMKESNLIAVNPRKSENSWTLRYEVEAGSPLYAEVFRRLVQNEGLAAVLDLEVAKEDVAREQKSMDAYEAELVKIEEILDARRDWWWIRPSTDEQLEKRRTQLVDLIMEQHKKLEKYHKARRKAMSILGHHADRFHERAKRKKS